MSKKDCQAIHAIRRLKERYSFVSGKKFLGRIVGKIRENNSQFIFKQSNRVAIHKVLIDEIEFFVVYDHKRKSIVTFLTEEMVNNILEKEKQNFINLQII